MSDSDKKDPDEQTTFGGGPPVAPKLPAAPAKPAESTQAGAVPPVAPPRQPTAPAAAPPAAAPAAPAAGRPAEATAPPPALDEEKTVLVVRDAARPRVTLSRVRPAGHAETIALGPRDVYVVGRAPTSDVRLYSPTASREHARLTRRGSDWFLTPSEGKTALANGALVRDEVKLEHRMRVQLGEDEWLVVDESAALERGAAQAVPAAAPRGGGAGRWWAIGSLVVAALAALAVWLWTRG